MSRAQARVRAVVTTSTRVTPSTSHPASRQRPLPPPCPRKGPANPNFASRKSQIDFVVVKIRAIFVKICKKIMRDNREDKFTAQILAFCIIVCKIKIKF